MLLLGKICSAVPKVWLLGFMAGSYSNNRQSILLALTVHTYFLLWGRRKNIYVLMSFVQMYFQLKWSFQHQTKLTSWGEFEDLIKHLSCKKAYRESPKIPNLLHVHFKCILYVGQN